jgi:hypothetical protein
LDPLKRAQRELAHEAFLALQRHLAWLPSQVLRANDEDLGNQIIILSELFSQFMSAYKKFMGSSADESTMISMQPSPSAGDTVAARGRDESAEELRSIVQDLIKHTSALTERLTQIHNQVIARREVSSAKVDSRDPVTSEYEAILQRHFTSLRKISAILNKVITSEDSASQISEEEMMTCINRLEEIKSFVNSSPSTSAATAE